ncbi:MAG TPA: zf-HC2 domain-containing protein [Actinomycetota bacterium]
MNCVAVRDLLPERALGIAGRRDDAEIDLHLRSCAACRKEARDLERASATLAFALAPADPAPDLEGRVVDAVAREARDARPNVRPRRRTLVALLAAALVLGAVGGGSVFASRQGEQDPSAVARQQQQDLGAFLDMIAQGEFAREDAVAHLGVLADPSGGPSRGSAMVIVGEGIDDRILVMANGLDDADGTLPFSVRIADGNGHYVWAGSVERLTPTGGFSVARIVSVDLDGFVNVTVRDAHGRVVLTGAIVEQASVPSPSS